MGADSPIQRDDSPDAGTDEERTTIRAGREFEQEYRLDASEAGAFLIAPSANRSSSR
ncbi:MAG: hypothetical protein V5A55_12730 [Halovenus sp.]